MRKAILILILCVALPASLNAEQSSWSNLNRLKAGQGIVVIESGMRHHAGKFVSVTDELLTINERGSEVSLKRQDVARVSTSSNPKRGEHAVIGLVVGGLIGAGIGAASFGKGWRGVGALAGVAIGGTVGAIVGVLIPGHRTVYRATPAASSNQAEFFRRSERSSAFCVLCEGPTHPSFLEGWVRES